MPAVFQRYRNLHFEYAMLKWLITPVVVYGAFVALAYVAQRLL
jgi:hypothetical protein